MTCRFTIYCHTNRVNGKRYVGQTVYSMEKRWTDHVSAAKSSKCGSPVFKRAILKHGPDAFDHEVLEVVWTQEEADAAESKWIEQLTCRVPHGYNLKSGGGGNGRVHDDTKRLIGKASRTWWQKMTPEERSARQAATWSPERTARAKLRVVPEEMRVRIGAASKKRWLEMTPEQQATKVENLRTPNRVTRLRETNSTKEFSEKVRAGQKEFWAKFTPEEKTQRVLHQQAGMSHEKKSERVRKAWAGMTPEAREARVCKTRAGVIAAKSNNPEHSRKMSEWQTSQAQLRTPEQRRAIVLKAWETRRAKYGQDGVKRVKTPKEYGESTRRGWAIMSPEARAERGRKMSEARQKKKAARYPNFVRINLLSAEAP
jgi:group I intron endonuclease